MTRTINAALALLVAFTFSFTHTAYAVENTWDYSVQVSSIVQASPGKVTLNWPQDTNGVPSSYTVYRRAPNTTSWGAGTTLAGSATSYVDTSVAAGNSYEYRIVKVAGSYTGYGYIQIGVNAPLVDQRGKVVLVVDKTFSTSLAPELVRLEQDLAGDGWIVIRRDVARTDPVPSVKAVIKAAYDSDPANVISVFLFGNIPVPYSGQLNPDGHPDHVGAWPADAYYGDMDGNWTDSTVNYTQTINTNSVDAARMSNRPGDGKFDQTVLPSDVELQVGRVDLSKMPGRTTWGGPATFPSELELLRNYLNKDHNFRHRKVNPERRAILGDYFGQRGGEAFAASGFRSFAPLVGADKIRNLNREYNDQKGVWIPEVAASDYLLAYGCGAGSYASIGGLGATGMYNDGTTTEMVSKNVRGVFNMLFGSWLGDWDQEDNMLRAPLATSQGLVSAWSGRPHWFWHPLGAGETIGHTARLAMNNKGDYQTQINSSQNRIHVALMGDPTLRLHPVVPAGNLNGATSGSTVALTWSASTDSAIVGYHVYRATSTGGAYSRLTSAPVTATTFSESAATADATYMVRAIKLENTTSGSYHNASQGIFWSTTGGSDGSTTPTPAPTPSVPTVAVVATDASAQIGSTTDTAVLTFTRTGSTVANPTANFTLSGTAEPWIDYRRVDGDMPTAVTIPAGSASAKMTSRAYGNASRAATPTATFALAKNAAYTVGTTQSVATITLTPAATGGPAPEPTPAPAPTAPTPATTTADTVWFDDALPAGAGGGATGGDAWTWVASNPTPFSDRVSHQSNIRCPHVVTAGGLIDPQRDVIGHPAWAR